MGCPSRRAIIDHSYNLADVIWVVRMDWVVVLCENGTALCGRISSFGGYDICSSDTNRRCLASGHHAQRLLGDPH